MIKNQKNRHIYRFICSAILTLIATGSFFFIWLRFVTVNNQTSHLLGKGNLLMATGIYMVLFLYFGYIVHAFRFGVERKASTFAAIVITLFLVDFIEVFISLAITGEFSG